MLFSQDVKDSVNWRVH